MVATLHTNYGSGTQTDRLVRQVRDKISRIYPGSTPFYDMLNGSASVHDGKSTLLEWWMMDDSAKTVTCTEAIDANETVWTLSDAGGIRESDIIQDPVDGECVFVSSISSNDITVVRSFGSPPAIAYAANKVFVILGNARQEGADQLGAIGVQPTKGTNYFQQFERVVGITDIAEAIDYYGTPQAKLEMEEAFVEYRKRQERQMLFGFKDSNTSGTHPRRSLGGIREFVELDGNNEFDANGAFTFQEFNRWMGEMTRRVKGKEFMLFGSQTVGIIMSEWALSSHQADATRSSRYGYEIKKFFGSGWSANFIHCEAFENAEEYTNQLYIVHPNHVRAVYMRGLGDTIHRNTTGPMKNGSHTTTHQLTGTLTLEVNHSRAHGIVKNIQV